MRNIGYIIVGFNIGTAFGDFALRSGAQPWGPVGEIHMLILAFIVWTFLVFA